MTQQFFHKALCASAAAAALMLQSGCVSVSRTIVTEPANAEPSDGVLQSDGYGYVVDLRGDNVALYHVANDVCIESTASAKELAHYLTNDSLKPPPDGQRLHFTTTLESYPIQMRRVASVPDQCDQQTSNDPVGNFDAFAAYFDAHYAFFDLYGVDWSSRIADARTSVGPDTSDQELFAIFSELLEPIKDGHVSISAEIDGENEKFAANRSVVGKYIRREAKRRGVARSDLNDQFLEGFWLDSIGGDILNGRGKMVADNRIQYGMMTDGIAYITFMSVAGFAGKGLGEEERDLIALQKTMDSAFELFAKRGAKAVIIDLSVNMGGYDFISRAIANRFANKRTLAYTKRAADSSIKQPFAEHLVPYAGSRFEGPVYVLTSQATVSGGEVLTMALRALPNVTHVGQPTRGALSDVLEKELPNGWEITLSNEIYADAEGELWEGRGIAPEMPMTVFGTDNLIASHSRAVKNLAQHIENRIGRAAALGER
ncbi:MAG: S41 family peptidase [Pseudomonadota bacterium]